MASLHLQDPDLTRSMLVSQVGKRSTLHNAIRSPWARHINDDQAGRLTMLNGLLVRGDGASMDGYTDSVPHHRRRFKQLQIACTRRRARGFGKIISGPHGHDSLG